MKEPTPKAPSPAEPPEEHEPGRPPPMIQDPPAPDANLLDPRVFERG